MNDWQKNPIISSLVSYTTDDSETPFPEKISWFGIKAKLGETPQEKLEKKLAMQQQYRMGIINEMGIPIGYSYEELGIPTDAAEKIEKQLYELRKNNPKGENQAKPNNIIVPQNKFHRKMIRQQNKLSNKPVHNVSSIKKIDNPFERK